MGIEKKMDYKKEILKEMLKMLHKGQKVSEIKEKYKEWLLQVTSFEIPIIEQELIKDGIDPSDIARLCDLHVELFRESVANKTEFKDLISGHPLYNLLKENEYILKDVELLNLYLEALRFSANDKRIEILEKINVLINDLSSIRVHFTKLQMLIFPYIEKRGIKAVPTVLWTKQDQIKLKLKLFGKIVKRALSDKGEEIDKIIKNGRDLSNSVIDMIFRENNILYPTLKILLSEGEWVAIKQQEELIGYYKNIVIDDLWRSGSKPIHPYQVLAIIDPEKVERLPLSVRKFLRSIKDEDQGFIRKEDINLETGYLSPVEVEAILNNLPIDLSFIDENDRVRYFNNPKKDRIFLRTVSVLGRNVKYCHPPKSVHIVEKIIKEFKEGRRDKAEFWIHMGDKFIYIRYFPVRDNSGKYIGTLEVVQDIARIKTLRGEKRLLDD